MWAGRVDRDSDPVLQDVQKQTQLTTAAGIAVGIVNNQNVRLLVGAKGQNIFSSLRPDRNWGPNNQWRNQESCSGGGSTNSVEDRGQRQRGCGGGSPLVRGSGGSCNVV